MTGTRLGPSNAEEVYLGRLLKVTLQEMGGEDLSWLGKPVDEHPGEALAGLVSTALAALVGDQPGSG